MPNLVSLSAHTFRAKYLPVGAIIADKINGIEGWEVIEIFLDMNRQATITLDSGKQILTGKMHFEQTVRAYPPTTH